MIPEEGEFDRRYAQYPILAYAHILPGVLYLVLAPFQVSRRFRNRHLDLHRKMGRFLVPIGILAGVMGVIFGFFFSFGGFAYAVPLWCSAPGSSSPSPWPTATFEPATRSATADG